MESQTKTVAILLCLFVCSSATRILENDALFVAPQNPSAFEPNLNLAMASAGTGTPAPESKTGVPCDEAPEMKTWSAFAVNATKNKTSELEITVQEDRTRSDAGKGEEVVYNVLPKGSVPSSGPSPRGNSVVNGQGLSRSVAHPTVYNMAESRQSGGVGHMQEQIVGKKRILGSSPSRGGAGH